MFLAGLLFVLSIPTVQTYLAKRGTEFLKQELHLEASINKIAIDVDGGVLLKGLIVLDGHKQILIKSDFLKTSLVDLLKLNKQQLLLGSSQINGLELNIVTYKNDSITNLDQFLATFDDGKKGSGKFLTHIKHLLIREAKFKVEDKNHKPSVAVSIKNINGQVTDLQIQGPNIWAFINNFSLDESRGISLRNSTTKFSMTPTSMHFSPLVLQTENSKIEGALLMNYKVGDLKHFVDKVHLDFSVDKSSISTKDIYPFYKEISRNEKLFLKTKIKGVLNDFTWNNLQLHTNSKAQYQGRLRIKNIAKPSVGVSIEAMMERLLISREQAVSLLPNILKKSLPESLQTLGVLDIQGNVLFHNNNLKTDLKALSKIGSAEAELEFTHLNDSKAVTYQGAIHLNNLDLGALSNQNKLGKATLDFVVDGKSFNPQELQTELLGKISSLEFNNYTYRDIFIDGNLRLPYYKGIVKSNDENALLDFDGEVDFTHKQKKYNFTTNIKHLNLNALGFVKDSLGIIAGNIFLEGSGNSLDDFQGNSTITEVSYETSKEKMAFQDSEIQASFLEDGSRELKISSPDLFSGQLTGKFKINQLQPIIENALGSLYTHFSPTKLNPKQFLKFDFTFKENLSKLFSKEIILADNSTLKGIIIPDEGEFKLDLKAKSIDFEEDGIRNLNLSIDTKNANNNSFITADSIKVKGYPISKFSWINTTKNDTLFANIEFKGGKKVMDTYLLKMYYTIDKEHQSVLGFQKSELRFKDFSWFINPKNNLSGNQLIFNKKIDDLTIDQLILSHDHQKISLNGVLKGKDYKNLSLSFDKVDLSKITPEIELLKMGGLLNGEINFEQDKQIYKPTSNINIENLQLNQVDLGHMYFNIQGDASLQNFKVGSSIIKDGKEKFFISGDVGVKKGQSKLSLDAGINSFDLKTIAPFLKSIFTDVRGTSTGRLTINGTIDKPIVDGRLYLNQAGMRPVLTGVDYRFENNSPLDLTEKQFILRNVKISDTKSNTKGTVNGTISHDKFQNWNLNMRLQSNNLLVLDKKYQEGTMYYGTAFIDGFATLKGAVEAMQIKVEATSKEGTKIKIPLNEAGGVGDNNFIHFLSEKDKANQKKGIFAYESNNKFGGIQLDFEFVITPEAEIEVLLDKESGHGMRGKGAGFITMEINTLGRFNMWGDFQVYQGDYNFKYDVIIDKKFKVKKYGTIRWDGDPLNALLDLEAVYQTQANPGLIVENSAINRKIDTNVTVQLTGNLINPDIDFKIDFPNVTSSIKSEIDYKLADKDTRQTQAMALLATGSFITSENAGTAVYGSLIERASSLFDDLFTDADSKFKIGLNYSQADKQKYAESTDAARVGVTLSTQVNDRILINGKLGVPIGGEERNVIVGDVEVQLLLNEDGSVRARVFNRENDINYIGEGIGYTQGVGITYEVDFDTFKEILDKIFKKARKRAAQKASNKKNSQQAPMENFDAEYMRFQENKKQQQQHQPKIESK